MMITTRNVEQIRGLVFNLMVGRRLRFDEDCMQLNWGSELMMIRIRIARNSRGLVLSLIVGRTLGFDYDSIPLKSSV
jgi:hypothetical protein